MTDSSSMRMAYIAETVYGVTPATPVFKTMRVTGESIKPNKKYVSSDEIRADGNIPDLTLVGSEAGGSIPFELSYGSYDDLFEGLFRNTWAANVLKNGVTPKSYTLEKLMVAESGNQFHRYPGTRVAGLSLSLKSQDKVTGSFDVLCKGMTATQTIVTGATYTAANGNPVINAANNVANLAITGVTSPQIMSLNLKISNNAAQQPVVGQVDSKGIRHGSMMITGDLEAYFVDKDLLDLYLNDTLSSLSLDMGGVSGLKYNLNLPKLKFTDGSVPNPGKDQDVMAKMSFQAIYDSTSGATAVLTRTP
ncbi:MAG: hypothetical protein JWO78_209 [Micavibrio sp.]|nr:hypothetical protein [Micavibrio sp.]